jgi:DNA-binding CsgD family transcriptional regulator
MTSTVNKSVQATRSGFDWYPQISNIISSIDLPNLPSILTDSIKQIVDYEHVVIFGYCEGHRPTFLYDGFSKAHKISLVAPYLNGSYLVDPFYTACVNKLDPGLYRMRDVAPDEFYQQVGAHPGYVSPCISDDPGFLSEEIGFFARTGHGAYIVLSLMRPHDAPPFSSAEFAWLTRIEPVVQSAMAHYWSDLGTAEHDTSNTACLSNFVDGAFESFGDPVLTSREREVARLVLRGHSSESIARLLGISPSTVKIHRRNIYSKLHISSQSELFSLFIDILSTATDANEIDG